MIVLTVDTCQKLVFLHLPSQGCFLAAHSAQRSCDQTSVRNRERLPLLVQYDLRVITYDQGDDFAGKKILGRWNFGGSQRGKAAKDAKINHVPTRDFARQHIATTRGQPRSIFTEHLIN